MSVKQDLDHLIGKSRDARQGGWDVQSTGEKLATALVLNRADWLDWMGFTIVEAVQRIGPEWMELLPTVVRALKEDPQGLRCKDQE